MANKIVLKKSSVASKVPLPTDLEVGELAVNLADATLYTKNASGTVISVGGGATGGDVVGPASATDNAIARFDTTTGKLIQNSVVTVSDTGDIAGAQSISNLDYAQFDTTVTPVEAVAKLQWDDGNGTLQVGLKGGNVNLQIGEEIVARVYNDSGVALVEGQIVYISGAQGNRVAVKLAKADSDTTSAGTLGMVTEPIAIGAEGFITMFGTVNKLNTSALTAGAIVYLSPTTAGAYTTTKPVAPQHIVTLGYVERVSTTVGSIYIKVDNGYELDELHNVLITSPTSGNTLIYDAVQGVWENANLTAGTGISVTNGAGSISIANTGVTSVTATSPVASSGGTTPVISMPAATSSVSGYLTSTDWNTFNNKGSGTVTSVAASVPSFLSVTGSPITSNGTLDISYSGTALPIANGGTGQTTASSAFNSLSPITSTGDLIIGNGTNSATRLPIGTNGQVLISNGTTASWGTSSNSTTRTVSDAIATAGQTVFTVSYVVGYLDVYRNGSKLASTDYTASNGTSVTLATGANSGDVMQFVAYSTFSVAGTVSSIGFGTTGLTPGAATGGDVTVGGTLNVSNGGTGLTSLASGYIPYGNGTSAFAYSSTFKFDGTNLGIGTSSPVAGYRLTLNGSAAGVYMQATGGTARNWGFGAGIASGAGELSFYDITANAERMRIDSSGNVGIGGTPAAKLQVFDANGNFGGSAANSAFYIGSSLTGNNATTLGFGTGSGSTFDISLFAAGANPANAVYFNNRNNAPMVFQTNNTERMRIDSSGNVTPGANGTQNFGSASLRWANLYTSDLHLSNGIGDYTIVEGETELYLWNNKTNKTFKFALIEVDPKEVPEKKKV